MLRNELNAKDLLLLAIPAGLEPATLCLEGRCSIQLSYGITNIDFLFYCSVPRNATRTEGTSKLDNIEKFSILSQNLFPCELI